jgi:hypothetical protein
LASNLSEYVTPTVPAGSAVVFTLNLGAANTCGAGTATAANDNNSTADVNILVIVCLSLLRTPSLTGVKPVADSELGT